MSTLNLPGFSEPYSLESIVWIQGDGSYAWVHFSNNRKLLVIQTLKWFEARSPDFVRIHKSSLINSAHLVQFRRLNRDDAIVILSNQVRLKVSRRRIDDVAQQFMLPK